MNGERKSFLKIARGSSVVVKVEEIKKQEVVNLIAAEGMITLFSEATKTQLRNLWAADRANASGPLVGKWLKITNPERGPLSLEVVSSSATGEPDEGIPF